MLTYAAAFVLLILALACIVAGVARANPRGARRCPRCRFDLSATEESRCPECGHAWRDERELTERPPRRRVQAVGLVLLAASLIMHVIAFVGPTHWTNLLPRFVVQAMLDATVDTPPVPPGAALPAPDPTLRAAASRWDRLVWQEQASRAFEAFQAAVEASDGSIASVEALIPAAPEMERLMIDRSGTRWVDAWPARSALEAARAQRAALDTRAAASGGLPLGTFLASELQLFPGDAASRPGWIEPPYEIHAALAESADPAARLHAIGRLGHIDHPNIEPLLRRLAEDPDPNVAQLAGQLLDWRIYMWPSIRSRTQPQGKESAGEPAP